MDIYLRIDMDIYLGNPILYDCVICKRILFVKNKKSERSASGGKAFTIKIINVLLTFIKSKYKTI